MFHSSSIILRIERKRVNCGDPDKVVYLGWSGGAKVLGKLSVSGRPHNLDYSRARAYCTCSRCGWGLFGHIFSRLSFLLSFSLSGRRPNID